MIKSKTNTPANKLIGMIGISSSKYYSWRDRFEQPNNHNGIIPKRHWILDWEREAILGYAQNNISEGYRRLTYMMIDDNIVAVSPSTTYRVLKTAGLLNKWNKLKKSSKGNGFIQPTAPHEHWHTDIKYVNFQGTNGDMANVLLSATAYNLKKWMNRESKKLTLFIYSKIASIFEFWDNLNNTKIYNWAF